MKKKRFVFIVFIVLGAILLSVFSTCTLMGTPVDATITVRTL